MLVKLTHSGEVREIADVQAAKLIEAGKAEKVDENTPKTRE
jgi:hypothetical protein